MCREVRREKQMPNLSSVKENESRWFHSVPFPISCAVLKVRFTRRTANLTVRSPPATQPSTPVSNTCGSKSDD
ncbi:hypothetical protein V6N11_028046 [Hibiscus sabdariffa]|uniref:Uncharacterized protein n=1 Tax=Hibiscus sabdariffa TaxID=183260 RepID=A0ABR2NZS4_9ROSI